MFNRTIFSTICSNWTNKLEEACKMATYRYYFDNAESLSRAIRAAFDEDLPLESNESSNSRLYKTEGLTVDYSDQGSSIINALRKSRLYSYASKQVELDDD